jgi:hypothetical protein
MTPAGAVILDDRRSGGASVDDHETSDPAPADTMPRR